jgi:hypothetical protein
MTLEGEGGVGKLALARGVHQRQNPAASFHVLDAEDASAEWLTRMRRELLDGTGLLVIRHVNALNARQVHTLASAKPPGPRGQQGQGRRGPRQKSHLCRTGSGTTRRERQGRARPASLNSPPHPPR